MAYSNKFVLIWRDPPILVYLGDNGDYVIVDGHYCSCPGYTMRTTRNGIGGCSHVYAARMALEEGRYRDISMLLDPDGLATSVWEVLTGGFARKIRRLLALEEYVSDNDYHGEHG